MNNIKVIILSAGQSSRMGSIKALLKWDSKITFIEKIIDEYKKAGLNDISIVLNSINRHEIKELISIQYPDIKFIINEQVNAERITSIKLGILHIAVDTNVFIQDTDRPFVTTELINNMVSAITPNTYVSPCYKGESGHPVLISSEISNFIITSKKQNTLKEVLDKFSEIKVESNTKSISVNINSLEDYKKYFISS